MATKQDIKKVLDNMILSASGWRGVFAADENEESKTREITEAHRFICSAASYVFAEYMGAGKHRPQILLGSDTRPTGKAIIDAIIPVLQACGCDICYAGICASPEIMAWARCEKEISIEFTGTEEAAIPIGFIYVSASHNPIGHNGLKFGLADGGVLVPEEAGKLIANFRAFLDKDDCTEKISKLISAITKEQINAVYAVSEISKIQALKTYYEFCVSAAFSQASTPAFSNADDPAFIQSVSSVINKPLGIVADFNGSARSVSIDKEVFDSLGLKFDSINNEPGKIAHRIVPEGESLVPCKEFLEKKHAQDPAFLIGYTPDCDGDRGNLVVWSDEINGVRALEAQEVFALACLAEFAFLIWQGNVQGGGFSEKTAVAVNDPTSMRIDRIAESFGISVFRAEVGEANVVGLARSLREKGYTVRILGEGSAGGNITHPSCVRDPIHTVLALVKMLVIKSDDAGEQKPGLFEIWCKASGQMDKYKKDFTLADIIASLPKFATTGAYEEDAVLQIKTQDHSILKDRYQKIFEQEWEEKKDELKNKLGICRWEAIAYNGMEEKRNLKRFGEAGKGGLKILFYNEQDKPSAFIWMRGSATEPVFRIMGDVQSNSLNTSTEGRHIEGTDKEKERLLLNWQRSMIMKADTQ